MGILSQYDITIFLLAIAVLLGAARLLGEVARRFQQPAVLGEILAGVLLGPTVLGALFPELQTELFPLPTPEQKEAGDISAIALSLDAIMVLSIVLFLLVAGMEVDLSMAFKQGKTALVVSMAGIAVPFAIGFASAWLLPSLFGYNEVANDRNHLIFSLFFATALSITALPVIAKILLDLDLFRTDLGVIVVASAIVNDLLGWMIFAIVLGMIGAGKSLSLGMVIFLTILFTGLILTVGRSLVHRVLPWLQAHTSWPAGVLAFAITFALLCAAATEWIGIHAIFGSFLFGVALGDSPHLRARTRHTIDQFVSCIFAPLFFASIGLHVDFFAHFDIVLITLVLIIATIGKVLGCGLAAIWIGMPKREAWAVGFGMNARGAMEIILGLLALQYKVIDETMFVALVVMALVTSMTSGTMMQRILKREKKMNFSDLWSQKGFFPNVQQRKREEAIEEIATKLAEINHLDAELVRREVLAREDLMPTGIGNGFAVPHARIANLKEPVVAVALSPGGIDFDAPDDRPANVIVMVLTPENDNGAQLDILAAIGRAARQEDLAEKIASAKNYTEALAQIRGAETASEMH